MKLYDQAGYTKEEYEALKTKLIYPKNKPIAISPELYKALKEREFTMQLRIVELEERNKSLLDVVERQDEQIRKLNRIIDALC